MKPELEELRDIVESGDYYHVNRVASIDGRVVEGLTQLFAEHPADEDEPVTEEWLMSVGMTEQWYESMWGHERTGEFALQVGFDVVNSSVCICAGMTTFATPIHCKTRGQVRRLCAALGINLKESKSD